VALRNTVRDCTSALGRLGLDVSDIPVTQMPDRSKSVGLFWNEDRRIEVRADLIGCALFRVLLHEYGHALGLDHNTRGIMGACQNTRADFSERPPTPRQIKMWTTELARLVLRHRERKWHA